MIKGAKNNQLIFKVCRLIPYVIMALFTLGLLFPEIQEHVFSGGGDGYFHMNQIYDSAMQIKTGHYNYFLSMFGFNHSARIVNLIYGPVVQYLLGGLLLICKTWTNFYLTTSVLIGLGCGLSIYLVCLKLHIKRCFATILACLYITSHPDLMWFGNQETTAIGAILLPWFFYIGNQIAIQHQVKILPTTLILALAIQIHLMTAITGAFVIVLYALYGFYKTSHKWTMIWHSGVVSLLTLLSAGNILGGLYELFGFDKIIPTFPEYNMQARGLLLQPFNVISNTGLSNLFLPSLILISVVVTAGIVGCKFFHPVVFLNTIIGILFLVMNSQIFPWDALAKNAKFLVTTIQYPVRLFACFLIPMILVAGMVSTKLTNVYQHHSLTCNLFNAGLIIITSFIFLSGFGYTSYLTNIYNSPRVVTYNSETTYYKHNPNIIRKNFNSHNLSLGLTDIQKAVPDYLPTTLNHINASNYYHLPIFHDIQTELQQKPVHSVKYTTKNNQLIMRWNNHIHSLQSLPVIKYAHTKLILNHHCINPQINSAGIAQAKENVGHNNLKVIYQPTVVCLVLISLAVVTWLSLVLIGIWKVIKKV